jgi:hypothetical protein
VGEVGKRSAGLTARLLRTRKVPQQPSIRLGPIESHIAANFRCLNLDLAELKHRRVTAAITYLRFTPRTTETAPLLSLNPRSKPGGPKWIVRVAAFHRAYPRRHRRGFVRSTRDALPGWSDWSLRKSQSPSTAGHLIVPARSHHQDHRWIGAKRRQGMCPTR